MSALTGKQRELLSYIRDYQLTKERSPSFDEMRAALGLRSKSGVHRLVTGLRERGFIRSLPNRARCIEVLPDPHLPAFADMSALTVLDLAQEARRRGLVLGHIHRERIRVGDKSRDRRTFVEVKA